MYNFHILLNTTTVGVWNSSIHCIEITFCHCLESKHRFVWQAFRLLCLMLDLVAGVDSSSWTMWIVMEQNQISSSVEGMNLGTTTVDLLRMPVFTALVSGGGEKQ